MLIDRKSRPWIVGSLVIFIAATVAYIIYAKRSLNGPRGGSLVGLIYGVVGSAMILFVMALALKKRLRTLRVGRTYTWMQGHVWLGLLAYPIILYHAGFAWGGLLTQVLMWAFTIVVISGVVGIILQQYIPTKLLRDVPNETIFEQIDHVTAQLRDEARGLVEAAVARKTQVKFEVEVVPAGGAVAVAPPPESAEGEQYLRAFFQQEIEPVLADRFPRGAGLAAEDACNVGFRQLRGMVPPSLYETVDDLKSIVDERRQLERQRLLHRTLHGWLLVHVPLSYAMIVLSVVHAVVALRYTSLTMHF